MKTLRTTFITLAIITAFCVSSVLFQHDVYGASLVKYKEYKTGQITSETLKVRSDSTSSSDERGVLEKGEKTTIRGYKINSGGYKWYYIIYDGRSSYISSKYVKIVDTTTYTIYNPEQKGEVTDGPLNVRGGASSSSSKKGILEKGEIIRITGYKYDSGKKLWYRTVYNGKGAYVSSDYVKKIKDKEPEDVPMTVPVGIIATASLNVRSGAGTEHSIIGSVREGDRIHVLDEKKDSFKTPWYEFEYGSTRGYVSSVYVKVEEREIADMTAFESRLEDDGFPKSYITELMKLHVLYPEWEFKAQHLDITWNMACDAECEVGTNLIAASSPDSWKSMKKGAYDFDKKKYVTFDGSSWVSAYAGIIKYYMDPRTYLNQDYIYIFMDHSFDERTQTKDTVKKVAEGTFLDGKFPETNFLTYSSAIYTAGKNTDVNPNVIASMIIQEQGTKGTSPLISGEYEGYEGIYNYFNVGAFTTSTMSAIERGLWWAKGAGAGATSYNRPWDTRYKAIKGGAMFYGENYVSKGQNTLYLKKFNVANGEENVGKHQYMTNISGAASEAYLLKKAYASLSDSPNLFIIPVYKDMPDTPCIKTGTTGNNNNLLDDITVMCSGNKLDLNRKFERYTQSYSVEVPAGTKEIIVSASANDKNAAVEGIGKISVKSEKETVKIKVRSTSGASRTYTLTVKR